MGGGAFGQGFGGFGGAGAGFGAGPPPGTFKRSLCAVKGE